MSKNNDAFSKLYESSKKLVNVNGDGKVGIISDIFVEKVDENALNFRKNMVFREKKNITYIIGEAIKYITTEYTIFLNDDSKLHIGCYGDKLYLFNGENSDSHLEFSVGSKKIEPILSFSMKNSDETYIMFNVVSNDIGRYSTMKDDGVIESYGKVLLMKLSGDETSFLYKTKEEVNPYFSCLLHNDDMNPVILFFNPKVQSESKKLPKRFRDLMKYVNAASDDNFSSVVSDQNMLPAISAVEPIDGKIFKLGFGVHRNYFITRMELTIGSGDNKLNIFEDMSE